MAYGFIYVLSNESMPGIYKIGYTTKHPRERMLELARATSCPTPFELLAFFDVDYPEDTERDIHEVLSEYRVNSAREFFKAPLELIRDVCRQYCDTSMGIFYAWLLDYEIDNESFKAAKDSIKSSGVL